MNYIKGKLKKIIFHNNESGYVVALFRVKETNDVAMKEKVNKSITVTGVFTDVNIDISMTLYGSYVNNERFGMQYAVDSYEVEVPTTKEAIIEFLASSFIFNKLLSLEPSLTNNNSNLTSFSFFMTLVISS